MTNSVNFAGLRFESDCQQCLGGFYCNKLGAVNFDFSLADTGTGPCAAGYYCKQGNDFYFPFYVPEL